MSGKAANGEGSLYREIDGAWRATYRVPGESRPRRVRGRTREEALHRRGQALTKALTVEPRPSTTTLSASSTIAEFASWWLKTVASVRVRRSSLGKYVDRVERITAWLGDVRIGSLRAEQVATWQSQVLTSLSAKHCGRHQSNLSISHGRGGQPRADRDEPSRPCTPTEDTDIDTAGAHGCRGSGRRCRRRGRPFRRRHRAAVRAGLASVGGARAGLAGPRPRRRRRHRLPGECVRRRRRDDARATQDGRCQGPPSADTRRGRPVAPPPRGSGPRTPSAPEQPGRQSSTRVGRSSWSSPRRPAD